LLTLKAAKSAKAKTKIERRETEEGEAC